MGSWLYRKWPLTFPCSGRGERITFHTCLGDMFFCFQYSFILLRGRDTERFYSPADFNARKVLVRCIFNRDAVRGLLRILLRDRPAVKTDEIPSIVRQDLLIWESCSWFLKFMADLHIVCRYGMHWFEAGDIISTMVSAFHLWEGLKFSITMKIHWLVGWL